jgi:hypothetical protein
MPHAQRRHQKELRVKGDEGRGEISWRSLVVRVRITYFDGGATHGVRRRDGRWRDCGKLRIRANDSVGIRLLCGHRFLQPSAFQLSTVQFSTFQLGAHQWIIDGVDLERASLESTDDAAGHDASLAIQRRDHRGRRR